MAQEASALKIEAGGVLGEVSLLKSILYQVNLWCEAVRLNRFISKMAVAPYKTLLG